MSCCYYCHQVPIQLHSLDGNVLDLVSQNYSQPKKIKISFVNSIVVSNDDYCDPPLKSIDIQAYLKFADIIYGHATLTMMR